MKTIKLILILILWPMILQAQTVFVISKGSPVTFYWNTVTMYEDSTQIDTSVAIEYVIEYRDISDTVWTFVDVTLDTFKLMTSFIDTLTIGKQYDFGLITRASWISGQRTTALENNWWVEREGIPPMKTEYFRVKIN